MKSPSLIPWNALAIIGALVLLVVFFLAGCGPIEKAPSPGFVPAPQFRPVVALYVDDPHAVCNALYPALFAEGQRYLACADIWGRLDSRVCTMILPRDPAPWIVQHEARHCREGDFHL